MTKWRFDIVVVNYKRAESFTGNAWRLGPLSSRDRVSFISASPSAEEEAMVRKWADQAGVTLRYLGRHNRGIDQLARCEYFSGQLFSDYGDSHYLFAIQEHYLDLVSPWSRWDARFDFRIKGDVAPDVIFDLDEIDRRMTSGHCIAAFADRNNPCWIEVKGARHIAPCGGNFIVRTDQIQSSHFQRFLRHLQSVCDDTYLWALYAEFSWGLHLFHEGSPVYDIKRDKIFTRFDRDDFYVAPDDFAYMHRVYAPTLTGAFLRSYWRVRRAAGRMVRPFRAGTSQAR